MTVPTLNLPILHLLEKSDRILIAGAGGGFDVFAGLPIYYTLRAMGKTVHLANYSFTEFGLAKVLSDTEPVLDTLAMGVRGKVRHNIQYYPEGFLSQWFLEKQGEDVPVWLFARSGAQALTAAYKALIAHLGGIDALLLVDGGVDSIMRGDEDGAGTLLEDTLSLIAADTLDIPVKLLACIGFGTEAEENVCHYHALENMAALARRSAFYGACALTREMPAFQFYQDACMYVWEQPKHQKSHISTRIIPAVNGVFGQFDLYDSSRAFALISMLMSLYWFFDASIVVQNNLLVDDLRGTYTFEDAFRICAQRRLSSPLRKRRALPY
jgi:hypothetical protein